MKKIISIQHNQTKFTSGTLTRFTNEKGETFGLFLYAPAQAVWPVVEGVKSSISGDTV